MLTWFVSRGPWVWLFAAAMLGCASTPSALSSRLAPQSQPQVERYLWVSARCVDGPLDLISEGFSRTVWLERRPEKLRVVYDTELSTAQCAETTVFDVVQTPQRNGQRFERYGSAGMGDSAEVAMAAPRHCGADESASMRGVIAFEGDVMSVDAHDSHWCRGFDAHFEYRRVAPELPAPTWLLRRFFVDLNRGDVPALVAGFDSDGTWVEPFTRSADGGSTAHRGRAAISDYLMQMFASAEDWRFELVSIQPSHASEGNGASEANTWTVDWRYTDRQLQGPMQGRTTFVIAAGEIFECSVQLTSVPRPLP